jgi:hypothetical protein
MNFPARSIVCIAAALLISASLVAQADKAGQGQAVVTIFAKHSEVAPTVPQSDVSAKANGKDTTITGWTPFKGANDGLELIILIDAGARNLGRQLEEIAHFIQSLGPDTKVAVGYMQNGQVSMGGPLTADHRQAASQLRLPAGPLTNPYFSLSSLAQSWPSKAAGVRREVVMFTDGVDPENRRLDPDDPYVQSAMHDSVRAGLVVYAIYWRSRPDAGEATTDGESLLSELCDATGGHSYWVGTGNPVSFDAYFTDLAHRLDSQYALSFSARPERKPTVETFKLKVDGLGLQVTAPQLVLVQGAGAQ